MQRRFVQSFTRQGVDILGLAFGLTAYLVLRAVVSDAPLTSIMIVVGTVLLGIGGMLAYMLVELKQEHESIRKALVAHYSWSRAGAVVLAGIVLAEVIARVG